MAPFQTELRVIQEGSNRGKEVQNVLVRTHWIRRWLKQVSRDLKTALHLYKLAEDFLVFVRNVFVTAMTLLCMLLRPSNL